jgi:4a-hydroxytetrahydrobiopterin dehydratase
MIELTKKQCKPCEGGTAPLTETEANALLQQTPEWSLNKGGTEIHRAYEFKNYYQTMAFVNALAWIAHRENHHPDIDVGYKRCHVHYSTHSIGGLSENDFICAAKIDTLVA